MDNSFLSYSLYTSDVTSVFKQLQFASFEDQLLMDSSFCGKLGFLSLALDLRFDIPLQSAKYELPRSLFIFNKLFSIKPKLSKTPRASYCLSADLPHRQLVLMLGIFFQLKRFGRSKFLHFFNENDSVVFVLEEPLTFFPLVHPGFDYHDWRYPFTFRVRFTGVSAKPFTFSLSNLIYNMFYFKK